MDPTTASFKRYWEPSYLEAMGLSLLAGAVATTVTYPVEFVKTIIQFRSQGVGFRGYRSPYQGFNPHKVFREMHALGGGFTSMFIGFEANLISRLGYLGIRNTLYKIIYDRTKPIKPSNDLTSNQKAWIAGFSGGVAALLTTPFTLISIRQVLDTQIHQGWRRNYSGVNSALQTLVQSNSTYKGSFANVVRHIALNVSLTIPYDYFHEGFFTRFGEYDFVKPTALLLASIVSAIITLPLDTARTRLMYAHQDPSRNRVNYKGYLDVFIKVCEVEGNPRSIWAGFYTYLFSTYVYAWLTVGITESFTTSWKKKQGLIQWQI